MIDAPARLASSAGTPRLVRSARKFLRSPKAILLGLFVPLAVASVAISGGGSLESIAIGMATAAVIDAGIVGSAEGIAMFPSGALLTGFIVAVILSPIEPWPVVAVTSAVAIASKYLVRVQGANVFNPAALALAVAAIAFGSGESWWGALPDAGVLGALGVAALGYVITERVNKLPLVLVFLGAYFALFTALSFALDPARTAEVFREPDVNAVLFFAAFMLTDPPTSPVRYRDQAAFAVITAVVSAVVLVALGGVYFLLAGLLVANAWEAWRRVTQARTRARQRQARESTAADLEAAAP